MARYYDTNAYDYDEEETLQQLALVVNKTACDENDRMARFEHMDYCESFTISVGGKQFAFDLNAPQCCALDAFIETFASECGYKISK